MSITEQQQQPISLHIVGSPAQKFSYPVEIDRGIDVYRHILKNTAAENDGKKLQFLDLGGRDGRLKILLGSQKGTFSPDLYTKHRKSFSKRFDYTGCDLRPTSDRVIVGDFCQQDYLKDNNRYIDFFHVIYSNNVFEHLTRPWVTVQHINKMLKIGGVCTIVAPFAQRYHKSPVDHFRYTHTAIESLFTTETDMRFQIIAAGYDTFQRRMNVMGRGGDSMVEDDFGGWRETWYMVSIVKKTGYR